MVKNLVSERELEIRDLGKEENEETMFWIKKLHKDVKREIFNKITEPIESMRKANRGWNFQRTE